MESVNQRLRLRGATLDGLMMDYLTHEGADASRMADGLRRMLSSFAVVADG